MHLRSMFLCFIANYTQMHQKQQHNSFQFNSNNKINNDYYVPSLPQPPLPQSLISGSNYSFLPLPRHYHNHHQQQQQQQFQSFFPSKSRISYSTTSNGGVQKSSKEIEKEVDDHFKRSLGAKFHTINKKKEIKYKSQITLQKKKKPVNLKPKQTTTNPTINSYLLLTGNTTKINAQKKIKIKNIIKQNKQTTIIKQEMNNYNRKETIEKEKDVKLTQSSPSTSNLKPENTQIDNNNKERDSQSPSGYSSVSDYGSLDHGNENDVHNNEYNYNEQEGEEEREEEEQEREEEEEEDVDRKNEN
jgi:hypothetical protein